MSNSRARTQRLRASPPRRCRWCDERACGCAALTDEAREAIAWQVRANRADEIAAHEAGR